MKIVHEKLTEIINAVSQLNSEVGIRADKEKLEISIMDPAHISLIHIILPKDSFNFYEVDKEVEFSVNADDLSKILKGYKKEYSLMFFEKDNKIIIKNDKKEYSIFALDIEIEEINTDSLSTMEFPNKCSILKKDFIKMIADLKFIGEVCTISNDEDELIFNAEGMHGNGSVKIDAIFNERDDEDSSFYSFKYIESISKGILSEKMILEYGPSTPLHLGNDPEMEFTVDYYLAPRVMDNEEEMYEQQ